MTNDKFDYPSIMLAITESELQRFRELETENTLLRAKTECLTKENEQLKEKIKKMINCWNCTYYNVGDTTCLKGKPHNSGGCFKDWVVVE